MLLVIRCTYHRAGIDVLTDVLLIPLQEFQVSIRYGEPDRVNALVVSLLLNDRMRHLLFSLLVAVQFSEIIPRPHNTTTFKSGRYSFLLAMRIFSRSISITIRWRI